MFSDLLQLTEGPAPSVLYHSVRKNGMFTDDCHQKRTVSVNQAILRTPDSIEELLVGRMK